jgi:hypothetical protein
LLEALKDRHTVKTKESFTMSLHPPKSIRQHINLPKQIPEALFQQAPEASQRGKHNNAVGNTYRSWFNFLKPENNSQFFFTNSRSL